MYSFVLLECIKWSLEHEGQIIDEHCLEKLYKREALALRTTEERILFEADIFIGGSTLVVNPGLQYIYQVLFSTQVSVIYGVCILYPFRA